MFDGIKFIMAGFAGNYSDHPEGRKLIWGHMVVTFFAAVSLVFIAYVSFTRYRDLAGTLLPHPDGVALAFTSAIALFMLSSSSYVATFLVQVFTRPRSRWELNWKGALIFLLGAVLCGTIDYRMNLDGAGDLAQTAGKQITIPEVDESAIRSAYDQDVARLEEERQAILDKYTWKGVTYFNPTKYHPQAEYDVDKAAYDRLTDQIMEAQEGKSDAVENAYQQRDAALNQRESRVDLVYARLSMAVRYIYFFQFILCSIAAYISHVLSDRVAPGPLTRIKMIPALAGGAPMPRKVDIPIKRFKSPSPDLPPDNGGQDGDDQGTGDQGAQGKSQPGHWEVDAMTAGTSEEHMAFLKKYAPVVDAILAGQTNRQAGQTMAPPVSISTVKNVKRHMKQAQLI